VTRPPSEPPAKADEAPALRVGIQIEEIFDTARAAEAARTILRVQARAAAKKAAQAGKEKSHDDAA
jgi:hypothetical protein